MRYPTLFYAAFTTKLGRLYPYESVTSLFLASISNFAMPAIGRVPYALASILSTRAEVASLHTTSMISGASWALPEYKGPHKVGTRLIEVPLAQEYRIALPYCSRLRTLKARIFYPASKVTTQCSDLEAHPVWATPEQISGFAKFSGLPGATTLLQAPLTYLLSSVRLPAYTDAPLLNPTAKMPVVVFSPGLGGTDTLYSAVCGNLASFGVIVYVIEHRDCSASSTIIREEGQADEDIPYFSPVKQEIPENRERSTYMLAHRCFELNLLVHILKQDSRLQADCLDWEKVSLMGHSFGGATIVHALDTERAPLLDKEGKPIELPEIPIDLVSMPKAAIALDIWTQPLPSRVNLQVPLLHLVSEEFAAWPVNHDRLLSYCTVFEAAQKARESSLESVDHAVSSSSCNAEMEYCVVKDSLHLSQSDAGVLFPKLTAALARKQKSPHRVLLDNVHQSLQFLDRFGVLHYDKTLSGYDSSHSATHVSSPRSSLDEPSTLPFAKQRESSWMSWLGVLSSRVVPWHVSVPAVA